MRSTHNTVEAHQRPRNSVVEFSKIFAMKHAGPVFFAPPCIYGYFPVPHPCSFYCAIVWFYVSPLSFFISVSCHLFHVNVLQWIASLNRLTQPAKHLYRPSVYFTVMYSILRINCLLVCFCLYIWKSTLYINSPWQRCWTQTEAAYLLLYLCKRLKYTTFNIYTRWLRHDVRFRRAYIFTLRCKHNTTLQQFDLHTYA